MDPLASEQFGTHLEQFGSLTASLPSGAERRANQEKTGSHAPRTRAPGRRKPPSNGAGGDAACIVRSSSPVSACHALIVVSCQAEGEIRTS
eukprot:3142127-Pleurochrysis_carterae.AAC.1